MLLNESKNLKLFNFSVKFNLQNIRILEFK